MNKVAIVFPGQGSQYVGMGREFYNNFANAKNIIDEADKILGYSLSSIIFEGPEEKLRITTNTQPAILVISLAIWSVLNEELNLDIQFTAGHSLGEYSALVASGCLKLDDAIKLVRNRGQFMEEAVPNGKGTMAAIMGLERERLEKICNEITSNGYPVQLANINTPNQIVISGTIEGVELASKDAKELGARRITPLAVSGPFHSILMEPAKEKLSPLVNNTDLLTAKIPVVMNVTGKTEINHNSIKQNLIEQVVSPVLWTDSVEFMVANGVDTFIEVGPSKVLTGLIKKINKDVNVFSIEDLSSYNLFKEELFAIKGGK